MTIETCTSSSKRLADTWNWGEQPDRESLERCAAAIVSEQNEVCGDAASTTLFSGRLRRRLVLLKRHFAEAASENASRNRRPRSLRAARGRSPAARLCHAEHRFTFC